MTDISAAALAGHAAAVVGDAAIAAMRRYHRLSEALDDPLPDAPSLIVSNHGFGGILDLDVLAAFARGRRLPLG